MKNWNEIRTAATVARLGTVSAAAEELGVHRATVIRHINILENDFGAKLFIRSQNGYANTDLGRQVLSVAEEAGEQFKQLHRQAQHGDTAQTELVVSCFEALKFEMKEILSDYLNENQGASIKFINSPQKFSLERGEVDIAFRSNPEPKVPEYVIEKFTDLEFSFFASDEYIKNNGFPDFDGDLSDHIFIGSYVEEVLRTPFMDWMERIVQNDSIRIRTNRYDDAESLVSEGLGIGALLRKSAQWMPWLREVMPARDNWIVPVWRITHVDLHRSSKVQSFLRVLHKHQQKHGTIQDLEKSIAVQI